MVSMKRDRADGEVDSAMDDMASCLMLLSKVGKTELTTSPAGRSFTCKTCNRQFPSFQALGGHRASHKKPKLMGEDLLRLPTSPPKPKTHECSICGVEFPIGQALGGHMRRHRPVNGGGAVTGGLATRPSLLPVMKKSNSIKRVLWLDLNLTPVENDLKLELGQAF